VAWEMCFEIISTAHKRTLAALASRVLQAAEFVRCTSIFREAWKSKRNSYGLSISTGALL
jgi:hypothetical protein